MLAHPHETSRMYILITNKGFARNTF